MKKMFVAAILLASMNAFAGSAQIHCGFELGLPVTLEISEKACDMGEYEMKFAAPSIDETTGTMIRSKSRVLCGSYQPETGNIIGSDLNNISYSVVLNTQALKEAKKTIKVTEVTTNLRTESQKTKSRKCDIEKNTLAL